MVQKFLWESNLYCVLQDDLALSQQKAVGGLLSGLAECTHTCNWVSLHNAAPLQKALTMEDVQCLPAVHKMMQHDIHLQ